MNHPSNSRYTNLYHLAALLLEEEARLVRMDCHHPLLDELIAQADAQQTTVFEVFNQRMAQKQERIDKTRQDKLATLTVYDQYIADHQSEIKHLRETVQRMDSKARTLKSKIKSFPTSQESKRHDLKTKNFSTAQIEQIMALDKNTLPTMQQELLQAQQESAQSSARLQAIYEVANEIKAETFFKLSREV